MIVSPKDWPRKDKNPLDLMVHDRPHHSSTTEWWYFNTHFLSQDGQQFSLFASFFLKRKEENSYSYSGLWAISDVNNQKYYTASCVDKHTPDICLQKIKKDTTSSLDPSLKSAMEESFQQGRIPFPDHVIEGDAFIIEHPFSFYCGDLIFKKLENNCYQLLLQNKKNAVHCELIFTPKKKPICHQGINEVMSGPYGENMFYYFIPRCDVQGTLHFQQQHLAIVEGLGWYEHEFGVNSSQENLLQPKIGWIWISIQLTNGYDISLCYLYDLITHQQKDIFLLSIDPLGNSQYFEEIEFHSQPAWKSMQTFSEYPIEWHIKVPHAQINLVIKAQFAEQEFVTILSQPSFWEGRAQVSGIHLGQSASGLAFVEQTNLNVVKTIEDFFSSVSVEVTQEIQKLLPLDIDYIRIRNLIASADQEHLLSGIDFQQFIRTMIAPIRAICDRPGKRWRSYALIACCNLVGGDFKKFHSWLAVPELIHTGSLIIDDVEDQSLIRRGGPACHVIYGEPHAINAGTAAYALFHSILKESDLTLDQRDQVYELYFDTFRAAHTGQAIDIDGHLDMMAECIKKNEFEILQERILATHRLKTACTAASVARMGAILGNGSKEQIDRVGKFFESLGIAFQIMDDVLNLRGFKNNFKTTGEDIAFGKVTYPIAKALSILNQKEIQWIWNILASKPKEHAIQKTFIDKIEACGALSICCQDAQTILDVAWAKLDPFIEESYSKMMLRAFSWYVINRHY